MQCVMIITARRDLLHTQGATDHNDTSSLIGDCCTDFAQIFDPFML